MGLEQHESVQIIIIKEHFWCCCLFLINYPLMKFCCNHYVAPNQCDFLSSVEHKMRNIYEF